MNYVVAIDGPNGSGKSTVAKNIAKKLGAVYLDTGAMYRAVTLMVMKSDNIDFDNIPNEFIEKICIDMDAKGTIFLNGENVTQAVRQPEVSKNVPFVAKNVNVRQQMTKLQQIFAEKNNVIADGRDMGTVVFPNATLKIYLDANPEIRAKRRHEQYLLAGDSISFSEVLENVLKRDKMDMERDVSPLKKADDAITIDSTSLTIEEISQKIIYLIGERVKYCE